jgi:hypothetical protein
MYFIKVSVKGVTHTEEYKTKEECFSNVFGHLECNWHTILDTWDNEGNHYSTEDAGWD